MPEIIRDFKDYSLAFPCNPHDLRSCAIGFRLLFWADTMIVGAVLLATALMIWFDMDSIQFQEFIGEFTAKVEKAQQLPFLERHEYTTELIQNEPMAFPMILFIFSFGSGILLNIVGTVFCMNCPPIPGAKSYGLVWFGASLITVIPGLNYFAPLFYLFAWQYWLSFFMRLSLLLGEAQVPKHLRQIHRTVFFMLISLVLATFLLKLSSDIALQFSALLNLMVLVFFVLGFFQYAKVLKLLRMKIEEQTQFWDYGNDDFHTKKLA